jgi:hypothetical protein
LAVLPSRPILAESTHACDKSSQNREECTMYATLLSVTPPELMARGESFPGVACSLLF